MKERLRHWKWRWVGNFHDTISEVMHPSDLSNEDRVIVQQVRSAGIAITRRFGNSVLFEELRADAYRLKDEIWDDANSKLRDGSDNRKGDRSYLGEGEGKEFLRILTPEQLATNSVYIRYALQSQFVGIANAYLGLKARLRAVHLWLNYPTSGVPTATQLWHRDNDDYKTLKIFTNVTDVTPSSGPFAYIPGSHRHGKLSEAMTKPYQGRLTDEETTEILPQSGWLFCTGPAGSVTFADTSGLHKGVKPAQDYRLMFMAQFASRSADTELRLEPVPTAALTSVQARALY